MFCFTIKDKLSTTSLCFFYALDNHFTFPCTLYMIYCLNCFSFSAWLLSFIEILYLPCLCYHTMIPVLCALLRCLSDRMLLQELFVCYYLPTRDEQELSLGMLIRCKRIYNFLMLHACFVYDPTCFMCIFITY